MRFGAGCLIRREILMILPEFIEVDEHEDVVNTLEFLARIVSTLESHPQDWKWIIIATHNALQGALVCTISGTNGTGALIKKERLASLRKLYERAKENNFMANFDGQSLKTTDEQDKDIELLNDKLRNKFSHFTPKGWSIETAGLPRIVLNAMTIIKFLMLSPPANMLRLEENQRERAQQAITHICEQLSADHAFVKRHLNDEEEEFLAYLLDGSSS